jgi:hypothetical protein
MRDHPRSNSSESRSSRSHARILTRFARAKDSPAHAHAPIPSPPPEGEGEEEEEEGDVECGKRGPRAWHSGDASRASTSDEKRQCAGLRTVHPAALSARADVIRADVI